MRVLKFNFNFSRKEFATMPKSLGGLLGWTLSTIIVVAVGIFLLSRVPPVWRVIVRPQA